MKNTERLAFDRATLRTIDVDGRMHVKVSHISKAAVNPYLGEEIPNHEQLGLDPKRVYMLLRDPAELEKAAPTFNNIPLLSKHVPVSADDHQPDLVVGSLGTDAEFNKPYLDNSLVIWEAIAIAGVNSKEQAEISCAYRYTPVMDSGTYEGEHYDGMMTNIIGNHAALVVNGRAGSDVVVSDSADVLLSGITAPDKELLGDPLKTMEYQNMKASRKAIAIRAAIGAYIKPKLAADAAIVNISALVRGVKSATLAQDSARIVKDVTAKYKGKLAQDIDLDAAELAEIIETAASNEPDEDETALDEDDQRENESDEDYKKRMDAKKTAEDEDEPDEGDVSKTAMDSAIKVATAKIERDTIAKMNAIRIAEKEVAQFIGEVVAQDSADAVYKLALDHAKVDLDGVHPSAYRSLVKMLPMHKEATPRIAQDASTAKSFAERFPSATKMIRS